MLFKFSCYSSWLVFCFFFVFYYISNIYYILLLSAHNDWTVRMMHDVVTDWAQDSSPDASHASGSHHDHVGFVLQGRGHYRCSGVVTIGSFVQTLLSLLQKERNFGGGWVIFSKEYSGSDWLLFMNLEGTGMSSAKLVHLQAVNRS